MDKKFIENVDRICDKDPRYKPGAYEFLMEALSYTQSKFNRRRHVSGQELLEGIKVLLIDKFGPLTLTVLRHWGIHNTEDFGNIVFNLVDNSVLSKTDSDNIENFRDGFDFSEVFIERYRKQLAKKISRMR
jgi:uncharacterized repeat protein (TIGR04138 family)